MNPHSLDKEDGWKQILLAALLSLVASVAALWPAASSPTDTLVCNFIHPDCLSNHWLLVWVAEQLAAGRSILHNGDYYWPIGDAPWLAGNGSEGFFYLPFHLIWGWPLGSNFYLIAVLMLNGLGAWSLAGALGARGASRLPAAVGGSLLLYAIHEAGAGRFSQVSVFWLAFFLATWLRFVERPSVGKAVGAGLLLAATSLFYWYYGLFGVMAGALCLVAAPGEGLRGRLEPLWRPLLVFSATYLALVGPLLYLFVSYWAQIPGTSEEVFPHPEAVGDSSWPQVPFLVAGGRHAGRALPLTVCLLAVGGLWKAEGRRRWAALGILVLFSALMAGPLIPRGPYELLYGLARPLQRFWWPYRHVVVINLVLLGLGSWGLHLFVQTWSPTRRGLVGLLLALSVPLQLELQHAPWHAQFSKVKLPHPFYSKLAALPGDILVELPLAPEVASAQTLLIYQLFHKKILLNGHALWVERVRPDAWDTRVAANSFLTALQRLERAELRGVFAFRGEDLRNLTGEGVRLYTLNQEYYPVVLREAVTVEKDILTRLFGEPVLKESGVLAWDATRWTGEEELEFSPFDWPKNLRKGGPTLALQAPRPGSPVFSVPEGPKK
ncbi:MAG TPA: hypothetical protein PKW90_00325 [Myxococcota bacterium]|nr:hypothetical protein [Myxococcota bacterium]